MKQNTLLLTAVATFAITNISNAALVVGEVQYNAGSELPDPITATSGDLLETSVFSVVGENAAANVRNGTTGSANSNTEQDPAQQWGPGEPKITTYTLDTTVNTFGYDISEILIFSGWNALSDQKYDLYYSLVGSETLTLLGSVADTDVGGVDNTGGNGSVLTRTYDDDGAIILSGVDVLEIRTYSDGVVANSNGTVYREFDVLGSATIPEPSAFALLAGLTGFAIVMVRRRR